MLLGQAQSLLEQLLGERELDAQQDDPRVRPVRAGLEAVLALLRHHRALTRSHHELCNGARSRSRANTLDGYGSAAPNGCNARRTQTEQPLTNGQTQHEQGHASNSERATSGCAAHNNEHSLSAGDLIDEERFATRCDSDGSIRRVKVLINEDELEDFDGQVFSARLRCSALFTVCVPTTLVQIYEYKVDVRDAGAVAQRDAPATETPDEPEHVDHDDHSGRPAHTGGVSAAQAEHKSRREEQGVREAVSRAAQAPQPQERRRAARVGAREEHKCES